jgi:hypothetical protein
MKLKALRAHYLAGNVQAAGAVYEADDRTARMLIAAGKAEAAPADKAKQEAAPKPDKPKPMTTASVPELVAGAKVEQKGTAK